MPSELANPMLGQWPVVLLSVLSLRETAGSTLGPSRGATVHLSSSGVGWFDTGCKALLSRRAWRVGFCGRHFAMSMGSQVTSGAQLPALGSAGTKPDPKGSVLSADIYNITPLTTSPDSGSPASPTLQLLAKALARQAARDCRRRPGHSRPSIAAALFLVAALISVTLLTLLSPWGR